MHHKVIIIDRETVLFGSFNFSNSANDSNDENIVIIHDPTFTSFFVEEFEVVWGEAKQ
jgi:phosphatidylserine/phosphatidylglycerophosphate/cardiolipin synthase-like enzyme